MDIWQKLYEAARKEYCPQDISPFIMTHHVACAIEAENGDIFTGFCIESCCGVMSLCAERVAALRMYADSGQTIVKRMIAFRKLPPGEKESGTPCGACREFFIQLSERNKDMEIMINFQERKTITLNESIPDWWGWEHYENQDN